MHYFVGSLITIAFVPLIGTYAIIPTIIAAIGKEVYDKISGKGTPEPLDIVYTVAGGLPVVVALLFNRNKQNGRNTTRKKRMAG